jgi:hypothetical protein
VGLYIDGKWVFQGSNVVVVPNNRQIISQLCPSQLPAVQVTSTASNNDTLVCSGGSLPLNQAFTLNVRTSPNPSAGIGGQISGRPDGTLKGPFAITGP